MNIESVLDDLKAERLAVSARLDAIDLALDNLARVYGQPNGSTKVVRRVVREQAREGRSADADARRDLLLSIIGRSSVGVTLADLRKATPKMDGKARSNALQTLKAAGAIRRAGNAWVKA